MPTFLGKTFNTYFKNLLGLNQTSNTGVDATTRVVHDGAGQSTSISLSDDVLSVQPVTDNTTGTFLVNNQSGSNILAVDTTNSKVLVGASRVAANTQYAYFGINSTEAASYAADYHYMIPFAGKAQAGNVTLGTGTNPDTSLTVSSTSDDIIDVLWFIPDNITVDAVYWWNGASGADGDTTRAHLCAFDIEKGTDSTAGDLSNGVVVADGADITNEGREQAYYQSMTVQSADIDGGKVGVFTFRQDGINSNHSISATIKYHIR